MKIEIVELCSTNNSTVSMLYVDGEHIQFVIEDGYRAHKVPGETRIPGGFYYIQAIRHGRFFEEYKRKYGHEFAIEILGVPLFSELRCHIGNKSKDTRGCTLHNSGFMREKISRDYVGIDSATAYCEFYNIVYPELKAGNRIPFIVIRNEIKDEEIYHV